MADRLISALGKLSSELAGMIANTKKNYDPNRLDWFLNRDSGKEGVSCLLYPVHAYYACFLAAEVKTRKQLEELWISRYTNEAVRDAVDDLLAAEQDYRQYISEIDADLRLLEETLSPSETSSTIGSQVPLDLSLVEANTGASVSLESLLKRSRYSLFVFRKHYV